MLFPVILGTAREGRQSEKVAKFILEQVKLAGYQTELIDVRDYRIPATDKTGKIPQAQKLAEVIKRSDALIIVSPEYNHTYPGELKMLLDMLYKEYFHRPVGLVGVSNGPWGGTRGIQALKLTCLSVALVPVLEAVYFPLVDGLFDEQEKIKDPGYEKKVGGMLASLSQHATALKNGGLI